MDVLVVFGIVVCTVLAHLSVASDPLRAGRKLIGQSEWQFDKNTLKSTIECVPGHYPGPLCTTTDLTLDHSQRTFDLYDVSSLPVQLAEYGYLWKIKRSEKKRPRCTQTINEAYLFTFYFYFGSSNYFHLHFDTLFPIYSLLKDVEQSDRADERRRSIVLMPTVEKTRMTEIDWEAGAFSPKYVEKYFCLILKALAGSKHKLLPLDSDLFSSDKNGFTCFKKAIFGAPVIRFPQSTFLLGFVRFIRRRVGRGNAKLPTEAWLGLIYRSNRRRILNEEKLLKATGTFVKSERVDFSGKTFAQQVMMMEKYTVLVGMNGAGLMNGIYLPEGAVCIQLAPYNATQLNVEEFGNVLKSRGPYLTWRSPHADLHRPVHNDVYGSQADTIVHVQDFTELIRRALSLGINKKVWKDLQQNGVKTEL